MKLKRKNFDFIILGAGSAGSVIARRLIDSNKNLKIALVESGPLDFGKLTSWQIQMPAALTYSVGSDRYNWNFHTTKQKNMNNRSLHAPRGKVIGGSSSINAMVYARGHAEDFNRWEKEGATGWNYKNVLPYFKKAQKHSIKYQTKFRGYDGPLQTTEYPLGKRNNILYDVFEDAGVELGYPRSFDLNGEQPEGFGPFDMTVDSKTGKRSNTSSAYLHPILKSKSEQLSLFTETTATKLLLNKAEGNIKVRTTGVQCKDLKTGEMFELSAEREVIVSLGAVGSPQLLNVSGIGDLEDLKRINVSTFVENNHVGKNLQDHLEIYLQYLCKPKSKVSVYPIADWDWSSPFNMAKRCFVGAQWFLTGQGICTSNLFESGAFIKSSPRKLHPDIQYHFVPAVIHGQLDVLKKHGFQIHAGTLRPKSRGKVKVLSSNIEVAPEINPNYLDQEEDFIDLRAAIRIGDKVSKMKAFEPYVSHKYGEFNNINLEDDSAVDEWIKTNAESAYHLSCTCSIGKVVDSKGTVFGTENLRVVDASIMPSMTSGNLNAPTIMIAEKISDDICKSIHEIF